VGPLDLRLGVNDTLLPSAVVNVTFLEDLRLLVLRLLVLRLYDPM